MHVKHVDQGINSSIKTSAILKAHKWEVHFALTLGTALGHALVLVAEDSPSPPASTSPAGPQRVFGTTLPPRHQTGRRDAGTEGCRPQTEDRDRINTHKDKLEAHPTKAAVQPQEGQRLLLPPVRAEAANRWAN